MVRPEFGAWTNVPRYMYYLGVGGGMKVEGLAPPKRGEGDVDKSEVLALVRNLHRLEKTAEQVDFADDDDIIDLPPICRLVPEECKCSDASICDDYDCQCMLTFDDVYEVCKQAELKLGVNDAHLWDSAEELLNILDSDEDFPHMFMGTTEFLQAKELIQKLENIMSKIDDHLNKTYPVWWDSVKNH